MFLREQVLSCYICEIFNNIFSTEHLWVAASALPASFTSLTARILNITIYERRIQIRKWYKTKTEAMEECSLILIYLKYFEARDTYLSKVSNFEIEKKSLFQVKEKTSPSARNFTRKDVIVDFFLWILTIFYIFFFQNILCKEHIRATAPLVCLLFIGTLSAFKSLLLGLEQQTNGSSFEFCFR